MGDDSDRGEAAGDGAAGGGGTVTAGTLTGLFGALILLFVLVNAHER